MIARLTAALFAVALWALVLAPLAGCSASAVHRQAIVADGVARAANVGLKVVGEVYREQQLVAGRAACGNTHPCADPQARDEAVAAVQHQWAPVIAVWDLAGAAHAAYAAQLDACQDHDAGDEDAGVCSFQLDILAAAVLVHTTDLRCALRGLGVTDPFPGTVDCGGAHAAQDGGVE